MVDLPALASAGVAFALPTVPPAGAGIIVGDVPVPLAPLQPGTLVLPNTSAITSEVLAQLLTARAPVPVSAAFNPAAGGIVIAGNVGISFPVQALAGQAAPVRVDVTAHPQVSIPGGPAQFSPNGTLLDISISDRNGAPITTFPAPITLTFKYNAADIGQANGDPGQLTAAYVIDASSPALENPDHFPIGTFVVVIPESVTAGDGTMIVRTQAVGSAFVVVTKPFGYVQTLAPNTEEFSSFEPSTAQVFGAKPQFSYLEVVEPQIGSRLLVLDPDTNGYAYVNANDVGPSGPPPRKVEAARALDLMRN